MNKLSCYQMHIHCHREVHIHASCGYSFITDEKVNLLYSSLSLEVCQHAL